MANLSGQICPAHFLACNVNAFKHISIYYVYASVWPVSMELQTALCSSAYIRICITEQLHIISNCVMLICMYKNLHNRAAGYDLFCWFQTLWRHHFTYSAVVHCFIKLCESSRTKWCNELNMKNVKLKDMFNRVSQPQYYGLNLALQHHFSLLCFLHSLL